MSLAVTTYESATVSFFVRSLLTEACCKLRLGLCAGYIRLTVISTSVLYWNVYPTVSAVLNFSRLPI